MVYNFFFLCLLSVSEVVYQFDYKPCVVLFSSLILSFTLRSNANCELNSDFFPDGSQPSTSHSHLETSSSSKSKIQELGCRGRILFQ